jgi:Sap, sulfolipid-1-addressing protein
MDLAKILPMAFVMVAGPQIISAFFFATSASWKKVSAAYVLGASLSITAMVSIAYLLAQGAGDSEGGESGLNTVDYVVLGLLIFAAIHTFRSRKQSEPPKWMGKLQAATPKTTFVLGFLLLGFFPSDIVTSLSVGSFLGNHGDPWWEVLPFIGLTLLLLSAPALAVAMLGQRAQTVLPKIRNWIDTNSWIISEGVIVFFIVIILSG